MLTWVLRLVGIHDLVDVRIYRLLDHLLVRVDNHLVGRLVYTDGNLRIIGQWHALVMVWMTVVSGNLVLVWNIVYLLILVLNGVSQQ